MRQLSKLMLAAAAAIALTHPASAQQAAPAATLQAQPIKRVVLQRFDVPGTAYETVIGMAEIAPSVAIGRHIHPGPESGYVIEGSFELLVDGEAPRMLQAGDSYQVPARTIHDARSGAGGAKVIATYVVEKGQPLASPAR
jgi:quercetin dioxygenase-like cupin family protein